METYETKKAKRKGKENALVETETNMKIADDDLRHQYRGLTGQIYKIFNKALTHIIPLRYFELSEELLVTSVYQHAHQLAILLELEERSRQPKLTYSFESQ